MKQELLLKSKFPATDAAVEKAVRVACYVALAFLWVHRTFADRPRRSDRT